MSQILFYISVLICFIQFVVKQTIPLARSSASGEGCLYIWHEIQETLIVITWCVRHRGSPWSE